MPLVFDDEQSPASAPASGSGRLVFDDEAPKAVSKSRSAADIARDVGVTALKGAVALPESIVGLADIPTGGRVGKALEGAGVKFKETQDILSGQYSEQQQAANKKVQEADGFVNTAVAALQNPSTIATAIGESIPQMLGGAGVARLGIKAAEKVGRTVAPWIAGAVGEGTMAAGSAAENMRQESADGLLSGKQTVSALGSGAGTAILGAAGGKIAQKFGFGDMDTILAQGGANAVAAGAAKKGFLRQMAEGGISEGVFEEMPQSIQETMWQNWANDKPLMEGTGNAAAMGMLAGIGMGIGGGGYNAAMSRVAAQDQPPLPVAETGITEAMPGVENGATDQGGTVSPVVAQGTQGAGTDVPASGVDSQPVASGERVGTSGGSGVSGTADGSAVPAGSAGVPGVTADTTAADALMTPKAITALDRVTELDTEATRLQAREAELSADNGYGEMFNTERQDVAARRAELAKERESITASWPKAITGQPTSFSTEAGVRLEAQYALMDAGELTTSHDENLRPTPTYPPELQPRQRDRAASEMQIAGIVQRLDPARLGESADAANGAPIVGADGLVESGNARTIALKRIYQAKGQRADEYKQFLKDNAQRFGLAPEQIDGMAAPVLVRVRTTPVNRAEFARQANAATVAQMSPSEQAKSDAARIDSLEGLNPDDNGDFMTGTSRDFVRGFMARIPGTEQSGMIDATGNLSQTGYTRLRNAVLAKAYGDSPVLLRMVESLDDNTRNLSKALIQAAPTVAKARQSIQEGLLFDADITPDLMSAVEELSRLKDDGKSVHDALAQAGMFGEQYSPETRELLQFLADNIRRPRKIAEFIQTYFDGLNAAGNPNQGSLLGDAAAPAKGDLMNAARRNQDGTEGIPQDRQTGQQGGEQRKASPSNQTGTEGDQEKPELSKPEDLSKIVNNIRLDATPEEKVRQLVALTEANIPVIKSLMSRIDEAFGTKSGDNIKEPEKILSKASRPSILMKKPWHGVEHIRDSYRFKTELQSITQLPGVIRMLEQSGVEIIKRDVDKLLTPMEWGWRIVAFDLRMPNGQLVEYYLPISEMEKAKKAKGHHLFELWRNENPANMTAEQTAAMLATQEESRALYQKAWNAYLARTGDTLEAIRAALDKAAASSGDANLYPSSSKSPTVTAGAGVTQDPAAERAAEKSPSNTKAAAEPSTSTKETDFIASPSVDTIAGNEAEPYTGSEQGGQDVNRKTGSRNTQGNGAGPASATDGERGTGGVRTGTGASDQRTDRGNDDGAAVQGEVGPTGTDGVGGQGEDGGRTQPGNRSRGNADLPAGKLTPDEKIDQGLAEFGAFLRQTFAKTGGVRMLNEEERAQLMPALVKILEGLIEKGVVTAKAMIAQAQAQMKRHSDEYVRKHWNKIERKDYSDAAEQAIENVEKQNTQGDLFSAPAPASNKQADLFAAPNKPKVETVKPPAKPPVEKPNKPTPPKVEKPAPAGRDIPQKTGRNFAFGDDDLTYEGGWLKKATQNVDAVELLKSLQAEGRQASREEQSRLAKFVGWGSSEVANSLFGDKLDKYLEQAKEFNTAKEYMDRAGKGYLNQREAGFYNAFMAIHGRESGVSYYGVDRITAEQLDRAKPDTTMGKWSELRDRLKAALTEQEWSEASRSTQYAHYTSKPIVKAMWQAMDHFGFKGGAVLEPGAGIGVFPGLMSPASALNSVYTGIEFDSVTGGILKQLFPDERVLVESFIDSKLPENFYDVAAGNPPFGDIPILSDPKYKKHAFLLHDYFFAKTIDSVKPGGVVAFISSNGTMDKQGDKARAFMAERADMVGAIRLPNTAFKQNAGTEVVTDIIFLRKKVPGEKFEQGQAWAKSVPINVEGKQFSINEYFVAHPEMVMGNHSAKGSMYGKDSYTVMPTAGGELAAKVSEAIQTLPKDIITVARGSSAEAAKVREIDFNPKAQKEGNYYVTDAGVLMQREGGVGVRAEIKNAKDEPVIKDFTVLRDAVKQAHYDQLNDGDWEKSLAGLQKAYKTFVKANGQINQHTKYMQKVKVDELDDNGDPTGNKVWDEEQRYKFPLLSKIQDDPDYTLVAALESFNEETGEIKESNFLNNRVLNKPKTASIKTPHDALLSVLNDTGKVDIGLIAERMAMTEREVIDLLGTAVYQDPVSGWVMADEYLSGNVKKKLKEATEAASSDKRYERNVEALREAQPRARNAADITAQIGMAWIPEDIYEQFLHEKTGVKAKVIRNDRTGQWSVSATSGNRTGQAVADWGTPQRSADEILQHALTGTPIRVTKTVGSGSDRKPVFDEDATEAAIEKLSQMRKAFAEWLWQDSVRINKLVPIYNDKFNSFVARKFDGRHLTMPGATSTISVFDHVKRGAWRIVQQGNTYLAHAVGSGKTFQMVISAMEQKRLGLINKPMMVVPNHMLQQFAREWMELYPSARLMVADEKGFHTDNRRRWVSRVAMSDLDGVIITHSAFKKLDLDPVFKQKMIEEELDFLRAALEEVEANSETGKRDFKVKQIEKRIERLEEKLKAAMSGEGKDKNVRFDETGVDMLYVDEAHEFRKLDFTTTRSVKGIDPNGSDKARDLWMKTRWLAQKNPNRYLVMASGTPVTNTMAELYTVQRFMANDTLEEAGIDRFDDWSAMYGQETSSLEPNAVGDYETQTRFNKFVNVGELTSAFREFADVLTGDHLAAMLGDNRPKLKDGVRKMVLVPKPDVYSSFLQQELGRRLEASKRWKPTNDQPNNPDPIMAINNDGSLSAVDLRFMEPSLPSDPNSKLNKMIDEVIRIYKETSDWEYFTSKDKTVKEPAKGAAQMVFSDVGFGSGVTKNRGFSARAWMEKRLRDAGVPLAEVAFMSDYKKSQAKLKLFRDVNAGRVRILVGTSKNMGTGVNAQQRLIALHHLDAPWYPADLEQREGRIIRQGNKHAWDKKPVEVYAYAMKGTYDEQRWGTLARKQVFIDQALSGDADVRDIEDLSESSEFDKAAAMIAEDPRLMQAAGLRAEIEKLERLFRSHEDNRARANESYRYAGSSIEYNEKLLPEAEKNAAKVQDLSGDKFIAKVGGESFDVRKDWGEALLAKFKELADATDEKTQQIGEISGFKVVYYGERRDLTDFRAKIGLKLPDGTVVLASDMTADPVGIAMRSTNAMVSMTRKPEEMRRIIAESKDRRAALETRLNAPFQFAQTLADRNTELAALEQDIEKNAAEKKLWRMTNSETGEVVGVSAKTELEAKLQVIPWRRYSMSELAKWRADELDETGRVIHRRLFGIEFTNPTTMLSRASAASTGRMPVEKLQAVADRIIKSMKNMPKVNVFESPDSAGVPGKLRAFIIKQGALQDVEGALHDGEIYLFASGLADEARAEQVLAEHEVTHYGLRALLGDRLKNTLQYIWANNNAVRKAATDLAKQNGISHIEATEEVLADMTAKELVGVKGWRRLVLSVRDWLGEHGFKALSDRLTEFLNGTMDAQAQADLIVADLVRRAREFVRNGPPMSGGMMGNTADAMLSRAKPASDRAADIIASKAATAAPINAVLKGITQAVKLDKLTTGIYDKAGFFLDRFTPETIKAGMVADYGIPESVLDQRAMMAGRQRVQLRKTGELLDKLATLTREESRIAYMWMNSDDPQSSDYLMQQLPPESIKTMAEVEKMIDKLSQEAVALKQLDPEAFKRNRYAYLRRSYVKHTTELTKGEAKGRARTIAILGDQYKGRGMTEGVAMSKIQNIAPDWWKRKLQAGKADNGLKGEKFIRLERRANTGAGTAPLAGMSGRPDGKLLEVAYWPAGETMPAKFKDWNEVGTWEARDTKGDKVVMWRDFTAQERASMGEIDEARYAIAKTLHGMVHDVEVGRYLEWLAQRHAKKDGSGLNVIEASEKMRDTFGKDEWVQVPETKIPGTNTLKYGLLAGRYLPGPIWNDVRQVASGRYRPFGDTYAAILRAWKTSKTVLSPGVHTNNVMANMVMADWHDVTAGHMVKALRLMLGASDRDGKMLIGRAGNVASRAGVADQEAAKTVLNRYLDSGGNIGTWATAELQREQLEPLLAALEKEVAQTATAPGAQVGWAAALQHMLHLRFPSAWEAFTATKTGKGVVTEAKNMISLYEAEDQVFRLAAWLKAKEDGLNDLDAGKVARKSFLDYNINAPWVQMMRQSVFPFLAFSYRAIPMMLDIAAHKPWKLMKLGLMAGAANALGYMLSGGDEDDERKLLPEEKAGSIWGTVPKLIRMPWNDDNASPVFLDIRRWVPVGDVFDIGAGHSAIPLLPFTVPGGPLAVMAELVINKSQFTGKEITLATDTPAEKATKVFDHLYKAFTPNIVALPGSHAFTGVMNASTGKTDAFGREMSTTQALLTAHGIKLGSYPKDVLKLNTVKKAQSELMEIQRNIQTLKREYAKKGLTRDEFMEKVAYQNQKRKAIAEDLREKMQ